VLEQPLLPQPGCIDNDGHSDAEVHESEAALDDIGVVLVEAEVDSSCKVSCIGPEFFSLL